MEINDKLNHKATRRYVAEKNDSYLCLVLLNFGMLSIAVFFLALASSSCF
jgi:hypothetical protein